MNRTQRQIAAMERVAAWLADGAPHTDLDNGDSLEGFNYETWVSEAQQYNTGSCGTVACIAGAAVQFDNPLRVIRRTMYSAVMGRDDKLVDVEGEARELLGLTQTEAEMLFYPFDIPYCELEKHTEDVSFLAMDEDADEVRYDAPLGYLRAAAPEQIAKVLRHFNETRNINWALVPEEDVV